MGWLIKLIGLFLFLFRILNTKFEPLCHLSSVLRHLSSVLRHLSSVTQQSPPGDTSTNADPHPTLLQCPEEL